MLQPSNEIVPVGRTQSKQEAQGFQIERQTVIHLKAQFFQLPVQSLDLFEINRMPRLHPFDRLRQLGSQMGTLLQLPLQLRTFGFVHALTQRFGSFGSGELDKLFHEA